MSIQKQSQKSSTSASDDSQFQTTVTQNQSVTLITREGLQKIQEELEYLTTIRRREVAKRLREAISYGDLSENSEYEEAKNEQAFVEGRIRELEEKIKSAKIITERHTKTRVIQLGMKVKVANLSTRKKDHLFTFTIVGSTEADPFTSRISNESPIGKALLGKKVGDEVHVVVPAGVHKYKILNLK